MSVHAIAAKKIMLSWDSDLAVSNKRLDEERFLQDLFSPGILSIVYHSTHGIWLPIHGNTESSPDSAKYCKWCLVVINRTEVQV